MVRSGWFNGLNWHRVVPNFVVQGGSPGANEYMGSVLKLHHKLYADTSNRIEVSRELEYRQINDTVCEVRSGKCNGVHACADNIIQVRADEGTARSELRAYHGQRDNTRLTREV
jgi:cyclophilin family peptidyl-prolyl cis-trans isomerase